jgi:colicin import membrane protein
MDGAPKDGPQAMRMRMAMGRIEELKRAGKHDEAAKLSERLRAAGLQRPQMDRDKVVRQPKVRAQVRERQHAVPPPTGPVAQARMKMQKLKQAADLLQSAGYPEYAAKARQEIGRIAMEVRREAEKEKARIEGEKDKARREAAAKEEAAMREEMKKMRREIEELRGQLKKAKAEAEPKPERPKPERERDGDRERR